MKMLSVENLSEVQLEEKKPIEAQAKATWVDRLPYKCDLPDLFKTGIALEDALDMVDIHQEEQDKKCTRLCRINCEKCHKIWTKAALTLVQQQQLEKAATGDSQMLQWVGKAVLKQAEALPESDDIVPTVINISGINAQQEEEIAQLKQALKEAYRKLNAIEAPADEPPG